MKILFNSLMFLSLSFFGAQSSHAMLLTENFDEPFPAWESGWLGTNSNLTNFLGTGQGRGNNPFGLWLDDGDGSRHNDVVEIVFNPGFASNITTIDFGLASFIDGLTVNIFDTSMNVIFSSIVNPTFNLGFHMNYGVTSGNGIGGFSLFSSGQQIEGNVSIDNVLARVISAPVPEAPTLLLLLIGLASLVLSAKNRKSKQY